jgi:ABC-type antimicrobial peptide transport system permease subunit
MARTTFTLLMLLLAGAMALVLGVVGIYGVIAFAIAQRTREVGVRIALGAQGADVRRMFVRQGMMLTTAGVAIGLGAASVLTRGMSSLLFEVRPLDPATYTAVTAVLLTAVALAIYVPARRATRIEPIVALRAD